MELVPLPGVTPETLQDGLRKLLMECENVRGAGGTAIERFNAYQRWSNEAARSISLLLGTQDVDRLVTTPRYWALQSLDPAAHGHLAGLVDLELDMRRRDLSSSVEALAARLARIDAYQGLLVVADTNIYLHHEQRFDEIDWTTIVSARAEGVHLVIPLLVVDELDRHKRTDRQTKVQRGLDETVGSRARVTLRHLDSLFGDPRWVATIRPDRFPVAPPVRVELLLDPIGHVRLPDPDAELVDRASVLRDLTGRSVTVATRDTGMQFRAKAAGLETVRPQSPQ